MSIKIYLYGVNELLIKKHIFNLKLQYIINARERAYIQFISHSQLLRQIQKSLIAMFSRWSSQLNFKTPKWLKLKSSSRFLWSQCITSVFNMEIDCKYRELDLYITTTTKVKKYREIDRINRDVLKVYGDHQNGKNNSNVEGITFSVYVYESSYLATFEKLTYVFPNLRCIHIESCNINGLSNQHLKHIPDLESIEIDTCNSLSILPSSLFKYNQKLKFIGLWD